MVTVADAGPPVGFPDRSSNSAIGEATQALKKLRASIAVVYGEMLAPTDFSLVFILIYFSV